LLCLGLLEVELMMEVGVRAPRSWAMSLLQEEMVGLRFVSVAPLGLLA